MHQLHQGKTDVKAVVCVCVIVCVCVCPPRCYCARLYGFVLFTRFEIFISMRCYVNVNMDVSHVFCVFLYVFLKGSV